MAVIAVSAGGATIAIGLLIVPVLLTALLAKVKLKCDDRSANRTGEIIIMCGCLV